MGVGDVRLTGGEPLVRRDFPALAARLAAIDRLHDLSVTTNGYLLERDADALVAAGITALQRLDRLAAARPLLPDHAPRRPPPGAARASTRSPPSRRPAGQGQRGRHPRLHRGRGDPVRALRPRARRSRSASSSSCRSTPTTRGRPTASSPARRSAPRSTRSTRWWLEPREPSATARHVSIRRRRRADRLHQPGLRAVLRRLQPDSPDRRGQAAHLPVLAQRDRPARRRCATDRPTRSSNRSSATRSGARSSSTTSTSPGFVQPARTMSAIGG